MSEKTTNKRAKIGDIVEFATKNGLAYAHYTHENPTFGGVVRVFDVLHPVRPADFSEVAQGPVRFTTLFPVKIVVPRGLLKVVGHANIAPGNQPFPTFRKSNGDPRKLSDDWWFFEGEDLVRVGKITPEQRKYPLLQMWNEAMMIERIESGWTPETDWMWTGRAKPELEEARNSRIDH